MTSSQATLEPQLEGSARIHGIMTAYLQSKAVFVAVELGLFDALDKGGRMTEELATELGIERRPTRALLFAARFLIGIPGRGEISEHRRG